MVSMKSRWLRAGILSAAYLLIFAEIGIVSIGLFTLPLTHGAGFRQLVASSLVIFFPFAIGAVLVIGAASLMAGRYSIGIAVGVASAVSLGGSAALVLSMAVPAVGTAAAESALFVAVVAGSVAFVLSLAPTIAGALFARWVERRACEAAASV